MSTLPTSLRRRGTGTSSLGGPDYPNYLAEPRFDLEASLPPPPSPKLHHGRGNSTKYRANSLHGSFLSEKIPTSDWIGEDVKADVLYPRYNVNSRDDRVDIASFGKMVQDRNRKLSSGTLKLTRTISRQQQLYGSSKYNDLLQDQGPPQGIRFNIYSASQKTTNISAGLEELLTEEGKKALEAVVGSKGWWVDVLCPSPDEMRVLSKTFRIHPLTTEDIQAQEPREKVELFPNYTFVCFRAFDIDPVTDQIKPFTFYSLIFKEGLLTFHFKKSDHCDIVRERSDQLKEYMPITPDWMNYALIDAVTDSFAPIILQIEMEAVSIDELSLVLRKSEQGDMLKRISRCRKKSTQLSRLLGSKLDFIKSLMKRYEDKHREYMLDQQHGNNFPQQVSQALILAAANADPAAVTTTTNAVSRLNTAVSTPVTNHGTVDDKKAFTDILLYLGDIQDHVVTMAQNINHYDRILHRAHTNYLAQVNLELTQTYNLTNNVMNRLTFLATVHIPLTLITSLWGMNVKVPGKDYLDHVYFYWILGAMAMYCTGCICFGKRVGLL